MFDTVVDQISQCNIRSENFWFEHSDSERKETSFKEVKPEFFISAEIASDYLSWTLVDCENFSPKSQIVRRLISIRTVNFECAFRVWISDAQALNGRSTLAKWHLVNVEWRNLLGSRFAHSTGVHDHRSNRHLKFNRWTSTISLSSTESDSTIRSSEIQNCHLNCFFWPRIQNLYSRFQPRIWNFQALPEVRGRRPVAIQNSTRSSCLEWRPKLRRANWSPKIKCLNFFEILEHTENRKVFTRILCKRPYVDTHWFEIGFEYCSSVSKFDDLSQNFVI